MIVRHLYNSGWSVWLMMTAGEDRMTLDTLANFRIACAMQINPTIASDDVAERPTCRMG